MSDMTNHVASPYSLVYISQTPAAYFSTDNVYKLLGIQVWAVCLQKQSGAR